MNIRESVRIAELSMKSKVPFVLVGHSGVGKTAIVGELSAKILPNHKFVTVMSSQMDVGDFIGLPDIITNDQGTRVTSWARPEWMPYEPTVLFLDEVNNCRTDVESALLQLVYEKRIHNHRLHPDSFICAAINPATSEYTTANVMSSALAKRFLVIPFQPLASETITWAESSTRYHNSVIRFLKHMPSATGLEKSLDTTIKLEPCPRLWEMTSKLLTIAQQENAEFTEDKELVKNLLASSVGIETAALFVSFLESQDKPVTFKEILKDQDKAIEKFRTIYNQMRGDLISETTDNLFKGVVDIIHKTAPLLKYEKPVLDVDSEDKTEKASALKALNSNVNTNLGAYRDQLNAILAFLDSMPNDVFFKVSYDIITRDPTVKGATQEDQIKVLDSHFTTILYLYSDDLITKHKTLFKKWKAAAGTYKDSEKNSGKRQQESK